MPGSTFTTDDDIASNTDASLMSGRQPPPVAPRNNINVSLQSWPTATPSGDSGYGDKRHARSASMDSLESSGSSSSGGGNQRGTDSTTVEYIPTRTVGKTPKLPSHNPLQFVKVQSPLYKKAEQQIKLTKEVKITREALKEGEEEWQSVCMPPPDNWTFNLDNWKSRRRKVSEKVIQRAEEMRQIEAEEQLRQEQYQQQQRKIKKFSEIVEKRSSSRSYNLDLYIGQGDDSGLGGTPEPDDTIDNQNSILRSDTSEGMTSEAESIDSDIHKSDKMPDKEPPKVPQKPQTRLKRDAFVDEFENIQTSPILSDFPHQLPRKELCGFDNFSSTEPSDVEGHAGDNETVSSEEDISYLADDHKPESPIGTICDQRQENYIVVINDNIKLNVDSNIQGIEDKITSAEDSFIQHKDEENHSFNMCIKPGDNRGFGFTLKGGKDQGSPAYIDNITKYSPADIAGLREGDTIISLNGELSADYSHASLIFSIKQAVYTGILDIVISRTTNNASLPTETKTKLSSRKSSFAEKIALFSSGVNSGTTNIEDNKSSLTSSKPDENKSESLVLRRRSAFENGRNENHVSHRRSSCLSQSTPITNGEGVNKRLSADLTSQFCLQENVTVKKGPPPPVPVKPKLRPKTLSDFPKTESIKTNGLDEGTQNSIPISPNLIPSECSQNLDNHKNISSNEFPLNMSNGGKCEEEMQLVAKNNTDSQSYVHNLFSEETDTSQNICYSGNDNLALHSPVTCDPNNSDVFCDDTTNIYEYVENMDNILEKVTESEISGSALDEINLTFSTSDTLSLRNESDTHCSEMKENETLDISKARNPIASESFITVRFTSTERSLQDEITLVPTDNAHIFSEFHSDVVNGDEETVDAGINYLDNDFLQTMNDHTLCEIDTDIEDAAATFELPNVNHLKLLDDEKENTCNMETVDYLVENKNCNTGDNSDENISHIQVNPSPLCLPLEKIDEDDVISASTTTSSETPDTETVIETLPLNLSPLPNDESNGEESSKPLNCQDKQMEHASKTFVSDSSYVTLTPQSQDNFSEYLETFENIPNQEVYASDVIEIDVKNNTSVYAEDPDDDYCRELDESIDQITSLDVIDEIEQRLMHQLAQQGDSFTELDEGLTSQLEDDINKQWLYFSEESELLEDLTPRNLEPPREPPPPPPPPDLDIPEKKVMPMTRSNSTKRIKKELWRRRSDFLGLDSPEGIDVDNILPPPPGLEEILKQEREQNQWLEKRLSLAESDISAPLYIKEPVSIEPQSYSQSEYCSEYFLEDRDDASRVPAEALSENWKENLEEDSIFENSCELEYVSPADVPSPASEETHKISESPQHKAKQNIHNLGAAPKAKIMDSNKWITEKVIPISKKSIEPVFRQNTYNQNYWLAQDDERKKNIQSADNLIDRRYSMPHFANHHPDVTVRTWGDREYEFQKQRPRSAVWNSTANGGELYDSYSNPHKQDVLRTHSLDSHRENNCDTDTLESEVHKCSCCGKGLCEGSAMGIEALRLYFHIECFRCCLCHMQLGNGSCGTDVQVKNNQLFCPSCFTVD